MSVNIYDGTNLTPIAGKTVPMPYTPAPQSMIGDAWVTSHAYAVGDYCIDGNVLYKCKTAHTSSAGYRPPYASYWDAVSVAGVLMGGIDLSLFEDYANYTKPSAVGSRFSSNDMTGGYKIVGDNVYVYIVVFITKSAFGSGNNVWSFATNFPKPKKTEPLVVADRNCAFTGVFIAVDSTKGSMYLCGNPDNYVNKEITMIGVYRKA